VLGNLDGETEVSVVQSLLRQAMSAVVVFGDPANRVASRHRLAAATHGLLIGAAPGSDLQLAYARAFIGVARDDEHLAVLRGLLDGTVTVDGLTVDIDLRWAAISSLAAAGAADDDTIAAELARDPTDAGLRHAAAARASRPTADAKARAWGDIVDNDELPLATMEAAMGGFAQPDQEELLVPYVEPFFDALDRMWSTRVTEVAISFAEALYPSTVASDEVIDATDRYLADHQPAAPMRRLLLEGRDNVQRILRARARDRSA